MNGKSSPYWKQGLVIGLVAGILFSVYMFTDIERFFFQYPECSIGKPCPKLFFPELMIVYIGYAIIGGTAIGTASGYAYGKFKNRKQLST